MDHEVRQLSSSDKGLLCHLPLSWVPYAELTRLDKPAGFLNVWFPFHLGSLLAACLQNPTPAPASLLMDNILFFATAFVLRSVGCTWNDIIDRDLDRYVARCSGRPMARGALSLQEAYFFLAAQYLIVFALALQTPQRCLPFLLAEIATGTFYPYAKRFTNYAQAILGASLSLEVFFAYCVTRRGPLTLRPLEALVALYSLAVYWIIWAMIYDTIYAFQDIRDDEKAGIKTMSVRHESHIKPLLYALSVLQVSLIIAIAVSISAGMIFFSGILGIGCLLLFMIWKIDLSSPRECGWWFKYGSLLAGGFFTFSLGSEYLKRLSF
ncbi:para-hydroxybenzoate-polyprenyltransferase Coq2 [Viridothelium virens]|uniref:Para-hydroxybenzoate-polyprenyltransferase Coq2 n=1 Tax=Viridothelium virens TaxID=1048519 RepID=A0A6A6HNU0_VIRVR|nr:para-hydroxybenzoate-polyprenyltransferase Coq2 [Viridothelium virens]